MSDHPAENRLEEIAAGGGDADARAHAARCEACGAYVSRLRDAAAAFAEAPEGDAEAFMDRVYARAEREDARRRVSGVPMLRSLAISRIAWVAAPLAAAAIFLLVVSPGRRTAIPSAEVSPAERFKGGVPAIAAIVERGGGQQRVATEVGVRAGDRLRVEVSLDHASPIVAGVLEDDGTWTVLLAPAELDSGVHFSESAARFDATPRAGWILAGAPEAVERARRTRDFGEVAVLPVVPAR